MQTPLNPSSVFSPQHSHHQKTNTWSSMALQQRQGWLPCSVLNGSMSLYEDFLHFPRWEAKPQSDSLLSLCLS